tara:strand:- start:118 stop:864 length:747 start_codon:yes stop_codon:yes gene_type:complete
MSTDLAKKLALNNRLFVEQLDQTIEKSGLPSSAIRDLINKVNRKLDCDQDCEQKKLVEALKKKWEKTKQISKSSEYNEEEAEKKYYIAYKGENYYQNKVLKPKNEEEIQNFTNELQNQINKNRQENVAIISSYSAGFVSLKRLKELEIIKLEEYQKLQKKLDNLIKNSNTSERRVFYKFQDIDTQKKYYMYMLITYYILVALYFIFYIFKRGNLKNKLFWVTIIITTLIPFIIKFAVKKIYGYINSLY